MDNKSTDKFGVCTLIRRIILTKFRSTKNCLVIQCDACQLVFAMKGNPGEIKIDGIPEMETTIPRDTYELGDFGDKFIVQILVV